MLQPLSAQDVTGFPAFPAENATSSNLKYPVILQVLRKLLLWPFNTVDLTHLLPSPESLPKSHQTVQL